MTLKDLSGVDWVRTLFPHFVTERVAFRWINDEFTPVAMGEGIDENERYDDTQEVSMFNFLGFRIFLG